MVIHKTLNEFIFEDNRNEYLKWKRKNVTLRGVSDTESGENGGMAKYGIGLYTAFLGNREMAREYGKVYFVVNAIPKTPKIVNTTNEAEIFLQDLVTKYCKKYNKPRSNEFFSEQTNIAEEMINNGYDGLVIKGREMVNYKPSDDIRYYENEAQLYKYYEYINNI